MMGIIGLWMPHTISHKHTHTHPYTHTQAHTEKYFFKDNSQRKLCGMAYAWQKQTLMYHKYKFPL